MRDGGGWNKDRDNVFEEAVVDENTGQGHKIGRLDDLVDRVWDVRQCDFYTEMGWSYLVIFSVLGSIEKEEAFLSWGKRVWLWMCLLFRHL